MLKGRLDGHLLELVLLVRVGEHRGQAGEALALQGLGKQGINGSHGSQRHVGSGRDGTIGTAKVNWACRGGGSHLCCGSRGLLLLLLLLLRVVAVHGGVGVLVGVGLLLGSVYEGVGRRDGRRRGRGGGVVLWCRGSGDGLEGIEAGFEKHLG